MVNPNEYESPAPATIALVVTPPSGSVTSTSTLAMEKSSVASTEIVTVEAVGVVLLVGASLVLMVTDSLMHVIPAVALGIGVAAWGTVTQVRRRVLMGATAVVAALVLLVAVPLVSLIGKQ